MRQSPFLTFLLTLISGLYLTSLSAQTFDVYHNNTPIRMTGQGRAVPYLTQINVTGQSTYLHEFLVVIEGSTVTGIQGLDLLLQAPDGQYLMLMSDVNRSYGGFFGPFGIGTLGRDTIRPDNVISESYELFYPANYLGIHDSVDNFPSPGPGVFTQANPDALSLQNINPNGNWSLFVLNDYPEANVLALDGWELRLWSGPEPVCRRTGDPILVEQATDWEARIRWGGGLGNDNWDVYYTESDFPFPEASTPPTLDNISSNEILLDSLFPGHTYYCYVRADCGNDNATPWQGPLRIDMPFRPCEYTLPYPTPCDTFRAPGEPYFDRFLEQNSFREQNSFSFSPTTAGDYFIQFLTPGTTLPVNVHYRTADSCFTGQWQEGEFVGFGLITKLADLQADSDYWIIHSGRSNPDDPEPFFISPCLLPNLTRGRVSSFVDSAQVQFRVGNLTVFPQEFEFYYAPAPAAIPTAATLPNLSGVQLDEQGMVTFHDLQPGTTYEVYLRTRCGVDRTSCWKGPFTFNAAEQCNFVEYLGVNEMTATWMDFSFTWQQPSEVEHFLVQLCPQGSHPSDGNCLDLGQYVEPTSDTLSVLFPQINGGLDQALWIQTLCSGDTQPWQGPFAVPLSSAPVEEVQVITCGQRVSNSFQGEFAGSRMYVSNGCFFNNQSDDENIFLYQASTTGEIRLFRGQVGGTPNVSRAAFFYKSTSLPPDQNDWTYIGCWRQGETLDPLSMEVEQDSSYYILSDYRGGVQGVFDFTLYDCENTCPPVTDLQVIDRSSSTLDLTWSTPTPDAQYQLQYRPTYQSQIVGTFDTYPDTTIELSGLERAVNYEVLIRTLCPDGTRSPWTSNTLLTGEQVQLVSGQMTRCNPQYFPAGTPSSYDLLQLDISQEGAYFLATDFPELYVYSGTFDPNTPSQNLLASIRSGSIPAFPLRRDTVLTLAAGTYWLVPSGRLIEDHYDQGAQGVQCWVDGAYPVQLTPFVFNGRAAGPQGNIPDATIPSIWEDDFICPDTSGWMHFYRYGADPIVATDDELLFSIENYEALAPSHQFYRLTVGDAPGTSLITNPPADYLMNPSGWWIMNRFWSYPITDTDYQPDRPIKIRFYFTDNDYQELRAVLAQEGTAINQPEALTFYKINGVTDLAMLAPQQGHPGVSAATAFDDPQGFWPYTSGPVASPNEWAYGSWQNDHYAELLIRWFSGGGGGATVNGRSVFNPVNTQEIIVDTEWSALPNPAQNTLWVQAPRGSTYNLMDSRGRSLQNGILNAQALDLSALPAGIYFLQLTRTNQQQTLKVVKKP